MSYSKSKLKTPKGTRDYGPAEMAVREKVFSTIISVFKKHGAVAIDTPVFELKEVLMGKYGEDSKLIYDLQDQGGELCSLRYDLTVPFARFLAMNKSIRNIKRYQIGKVYRRDQPIMTKGRYREFYQCDFDYAGEFFAPMVPEAEILKIISEVLDRLDIGKYKIKINHRLLLDAIFAVCGVPDDKFRAICSCVDKLDKSPWTEVRQEMVVQKGLDPEAADKIWSYVQRKGGAELVEDLLKDAQLLAHPSSEKALSDLSMLFKYIKIFGLSENVSFDLSLARGLDYYTGMIQETIIESVDGVGSISGGGRYDNLVNMFSEGKHHLPCVGFSFGVERIFSIMEAKSQLANKTSDIQVLVSSIGAQLMSARMEVTNDLWSAGIAAEFSYKPSPKILDQFSYCEKNGIPLIVFFGSDEFDAGNVLIKRTDDREDKGKLVSRNEAASEVKRLLDAIGLSKSMNSLSL